MMSHLELLVVANLMTVVFFCVLFFAFWFDVGLVVIYTPSVVVLKMRYLYFN